ncbi:hypothetical protein [Rhizobium leguminosarum]|uniref:hypothetical protein n=1 Tax=Rhizobium leguminosarum TaxID=384 RepID=UPI00103152D9|nr:hypothetical protein [Rhizobium leguminosarum]TAV81553.1 hypothetical protein ELI22_33915 [Rhizobium leguminosarum]TAV94159.1 hypothetical protein ELI21_10310 [Rhizobium leguminosarum]TAW35234.1 hypothetical protein ELI23_10350 [Rhizobium leguminosarum]
MNRTFNRQELYDLVWSTPILKLAEQFGISDRGLAKICARFHIAVPGHGYWAKIEAGQPATKTPLWKTDNPAFQTIEIGATQSQRNPQLAFAARAADEAVRAAPRRAQSWTAAAVATSIRDIEVVADPPAPPVFGHVEQPHSSIAGIVAGLRNSVPDRDGEVSINGIRIHRDSRARVIAFLHHLALCLETRLVSIGHDDKGLKAEIAQDVVRLEISEGRRLERHEPTPSELRREREFEQRQNLARRSGRWLPHESFYPEYDYQYSSKLTFEIHNWADGARKKWADGKRQTLEGVLEGIADGVVYHLHFDKARREKREEDEKRWQHMAHRRELHKRRIEREHKRVGLLMELAAFQREAADLRATISNAAVVVEDADPEYQRMIDWAKRRLAHLEAQNAPGILTANLRAQNLFPDIDELHDPEGDPH